MTAADALERARRAVDDGVRRNAGGHPAQASRSFRAALRTLDAVGAVERAPDARALARVRARALLGLVLSDFELRADTVACLEVLAQAQGAAAEAGDRGAGVAVEGQRGMLHMRSGDLAAALAALHRAADRLDEADPVDACRILLNRGNVHLDLGRLERARADLEACAERAAQIGEVGLLFKARHNLGYVEFLAGDLPAALRAMSSAMALNHAVSPAVALLDRARVLLEAGLVSDADATLGQAADLFARQRLAHDLAEVDLARADAALLAARPADAVRWAGAARRRFAGRKNATWTARAELTLVRARLAALLQEVDRSPGSRADPARRRALLTLAGRAGALADEQDGRAGALGRDVARAARLVAAQALVAAGRPDDAAAALALVGPAGSRDALSLATQARVVRAELAFAAGDTASGRRHVRAGLGTLAEHRRRLGSVEAVTAAAVHGARLAEVDLGVALASGNPAAVLDAAERGRATFAGPARVTPPQDPELAELLARLRRQVEAERSLPPDAGERVHAERQALRREVARLSDLARERSWQLGDGTGAPPAVRTADLRRALAWDVGQRTAGRTRGGGAAGPRSGSPPGAHVGPVTVAEVVVHRGEVHAVRVNRDGVTLLPLGSAADLDAVARRLRADLTVLANPTLPDVLRTAARRSLDRGLERLDRQLVAPLATDGPLHVVTGGALVTLPWGLVPSRAGRPTSVATRLELSSGGRRRPGVVALAGPGLGHATREAEAVAEAWATVGGVPGVPGVGRAPTLGGDSPEHDGPSGLRGVQALAGSAATCSAAADALRTAGVVHLAAHGRHEADNPLFSWVRLADGPLFAHELEGTDLAGSVVVLSACELGRATVRPGGQVLGLASVLLRLGASAVIASLAPLRDDVAASVMPAVHAQIARGASPSTALAAACSDADEPIPLTCFGPAPLAVA